MKCFGFSLYFQFLFHLFILIMIIPVTTVTHSTVLSHVIYSPIAHHTLLSPCAESAVKHQPTICPDYCG